MRRMKLAALLSAVVACSGIAVITNAAMPQPTAQDKELLESARAIFEPIPEKAALHGKAPDAKQVALGEMLFFDPRLSKSGLISCHTCHNLGLGGGDSAPTSTGHGWQKGPRNAPTVLNAVFNAAQFWDGRAADLREQAKGPVQAGVEMNNTPERVVTTLNSMDGYVRAFNDAFPGQAQAVSFDNMAQAIEAYEATLITPHGRFDAFLKGDVQALNEAEKRGLSKFMDSGCTACHSGVNLGGQSYFQFGMINAPDGKVRPAGDHGRQEVTKDEADKYAFRSPGLRNVALTAPYFHSGAVWSLEEAVKVMAKAQLDLEMTDADAADIAAFLETLNGQMPTVRQPVLPPRGKNTPLPDLN